MDHEELVERYLSAWNRQDIEAILALLHEGAAYYDAFWRETCVGRDLKQYLSDWFEIEKHYYFKTGSLLVVDNSIVLRYSAHDGNDPGKFPVLYTGAEVLIVRDGKILTSTDFYCSSVQEDLQEVAMLAQQRHGESRYATAGLSAGKSARLRHRLAGMIDSDIARIPAEFTLSQLAAQIGCEVEHLLQIIDSEYGLNIGEKNDQQGAQHVRDVLCGTAATKDTTRH